MVKNKALFILVVVTLLIFFVGAILLVPFSYNTTVNKEEILSLKGLLLNNTEFDILNSFCKKSNKMSGIPPKMYKEIMIAEISVNNTDKKNKNALFEMAEFYRCANTAVKQSGNDEYTNYRILKKIKKHTTDKWTEPIYDNNSIWYVSFPPNENLYGKSAAEFYIVFNEEKPTIVYLILDQSV